MIKPQQKNVNKKGNTKLETIGASTAYKKTFTTTDGTVLIVDPELDRFSGDGYLPEKHKEDEIRLANSVLKGPLSFLK